MGTGARSAGFTEARDAAPWIVRAIITYKEFTDRNKAFQREESQRHAQAILNDSASVIRTYGISCATSDLAFIYSDFSVGFFPTLYVTDETGPYNPSFMDHGFEFYVKERLLFAVERTGEGVASLYGPMNDTFDLGKYLAGEMQPRAKFPEDTPQSDHVEDAGPFASMALVPDSDHLIGRAWDSAGSDDGYSRALSGIAVAIQLKRIADLLDAIHYEGTEDKNL